MKSVGGPSTSSLPLRRQPNLPFSFSACSPTQLNFPAQRGPLPPSLRAPPPVADGRGPPVIRFHRPSECRLLSLTGGGHPSSASSCPRRALRPSRGRARIGPRLGVHAAPSPRVGPHARAIPLALFKAPSAPCRPIPCTKTPPPNPSRPPPRAAVPSLVRRLSAVGKPPVKPREGEEHSGCFSARFLMFQCTLAFAGAPPPRLLAARRHPSPSLPRKVTRGFAKHSSLSRCKPRIDWCTPAPFSPERRRSPSCRRRPCAAPAARIRPGPPDLKSTTKIRLNPTGQSQPHRSTQRFKP
jgi:hypothetical protein